MLTSKMFRIKFRFAAFLRMKQQAFGDTHVAASSFPLTLFWLRRIASTVASTWSFRFELGPICDLRVVKSSMFRSSSFILTINLMATTTTLPSWSWRVACSSEAKSGRLRCQQGAIEFLMVHLCWLVDGELFSGALPVHPRDCKVCMSLQYRMKTALKLIPIFEITKYVLGPLDSIAVKVEIKVMW